MTDLLERIMKLLRLAASHDGEEARTAAHVAAKLIIEHQVLLQLPERLATRTAIPFEDILSSIFDMSGLKEAADEIKKKEKLRADEIRRASKNNTVDRSRSKSKGSLSWQKMTSRHAGICKICGKSIERNEIIYWRKGHGANHIVCYESKKL